MHGFVAAGAGDDLHGVFAPAADAQTTKAVRRKERVVPPKKFVWRQRRPLRARGGEEEFSQVVHGARRSRKAGARKPQVTCDGTADVAFVERHAFDGGRPDRIRREASREVRELVCVGQSEHGA